ncbi:MAG TPA: hypothetical protein VK145_02130 [Candidatus Nanoarchaeia archaeon]|nr:hypothetical protein [Candidatus Nanoarchaeia archaeon]
MNRGFIRYIVIIIAAIILLKYWLHIDVVAWLNKPEIKDSVSHFWNAYVKETVFAILKYIKDIVS